MKNIIIGAASFVIALLLIMTVYTFQGREARNEEIHDGLSNAMTAAGEQMKEGGAYESDAAFETAFLENLMQQLDSSSNVEVTVLRADSQKGVISAEVTETYEHPNGKEGKVSCKRTLILDREDESVAEEKKKNSYLASFYTEQGLKEDSLYKTSLLLKGQRVKVPKDPEKEGYAFVEWRNARTNEKADFTEGISQEEIYYAVWKEA